MADQTTLSSAVRDLAGLVADFRQLAVQALVRMYLPDEKIFAFRLRGGDVPVRLEGVSPRYTAIVLLALADESPELAAEVLHGASPGEVCAALAERIAGTQDVGEVALTLWAARRLEHACAPAVLEQLRQMEPDHRVYPTVEVAWSLTAQVVPGGAGADEGFAERIAQRLLASFRPEGALFPHWPQGATPSRLRAHVGCYADLVYPIQALSYYHTATGRSDALEVANRCARRMCALQGDAGQWWWHYDVRTGRMLEKFPVYSVHQDSMGPMALRALADAGGDKHPEAIERSMFWLVDAPELDQSLVDREAGIIWRKVARNEPGKLVRGLQAAASSVFPALRVPAANLIFPPGRVDFESRPYHMGWILHAWREGWDA